MLITSKYNEENLIDECWYNSSNILYSKFIENKDKNEGDLYVTFNNGSTYKYKNVLISPDYVLFKHGGLDGSNGKTLNKQIKPKYECEKVEPMSISEIENRKNQILQENIEKNAENNENLGED